MTKEGRDTKNNKIQVHDTTGSKNPSRILLAEVDDAMRIHLAVELRNRGYKVTECPTGTQLLERLKYFAIRKEPAVFDLIICDIRMPSATGLEVLEVLHRHEDFPPIVLIAAFVDEEVYLNAQRLEASAIFVKPYKLEDLLTKVSDILGHRSCPVG